MPAPIEATFSIGGIAFTISQLATGGIAFISFLISVHTYYYNRLAFKRSETVIKSTETQKVYDLWFSVPYMNLRTEVAAIIKKVSSHSATENSSLRDLLLQRDVREIISEQEFSKLKEIIYFFDKVGWLAAAELINVEYILGPMHHSVIAYWEQLEPLILRMRAQTRVHSLGFEWLYNFACQNSHDQILAFFFTKKSSFYDRLKFRLSTLNT